MSVIFCLSGCFVYSSRQNDPAVAKVFYQSVLQENVDLLNTAEIQESLRQLKGLSDIRQNLKSGKIKKIVLKNFMCHSNFQVKLNTNVNVFVGLNGSGKSAILTALAIGLGSSASATSRSTNLKDLVKRGETSATIEITLTNDGMDAYDGNCTLNCFMNEMMIKPFF